MFWTCFNWAVLLVSHLSCHNRLLFLRGAKNPLALWRMFWTCFNWAVLLVSHISCHNRLLFLRGAKNPMALKCVLGLVLIEQFFSLRAYMGNFRTLFLGRRARWKCILIIQHGSLLVYVSNEQFFSWVYSRSKLSIDSTFSYDCFDLFKHVRHHSSRV